MSSKKPSLASPIAPEDIRRGFYVAVLHVIDQYHPCWFDSQSQVGPVNIRMMPEDEPQPLKVTDVCLPFVTALKASGAVTTLDVRRHELARLNDTYARRVIKRLRARRLNKNKMNK